MTRTASRARRPLAYSAAATVWAHSASSATSPSAAPSPSGGSRDHPASMEAVASRRSRGVSPLPTDRPRLGAMHLLRRGHAHRARLVRDREGRKGRMRPRRNLRRLRGPLDGYSPPRRIQSRQQGRADARRVPSHDPPRPPRWRVYAHDRNGCWSQPPTRLADPTGQLGEVVLHKLGLEFCVCDGGEDWVACHLRDLHHPEAELDTRKALDRADSAE